MYLDKYEGQNNGIEFEGCDQCKMDSALKNYLFVTYAPTFTCSHGVNKMLFTLH